MKNNINPNELQESRQPKAGDIWLCGEGAVLVFGVSDSWVEYLWQDTPDRFERDGRMIEDWHKHFEYKENIFDCEELKDEMPQDYQEIKAQQRVFEAMASGQTTIPKKSMTQLITQAIIRQTLVALNVLRLHKTCPFV